MSREFFKWATKAIEDQVYNGFLLWHMRENSSIYNDRFEGDIIQCLLFAKTGTGSEKWNGCEDISEFFSDVAKILEISVEQVRGLYYVRHVIPSGTKNFCKKFYNFGEKIRARGMETFTVRVNLNLCFVDNFVFYQTQTKVYFDYSSGYKVGLIPQNPDSTSSRWDAQEFLKNKFQKTGHGSPIHLCFSWLDQG